MSNQANENAELRAFLAENPDAILEKVATDYGVTFLDCLNHMPEGMVTVHDAGEVADVLNEVATWGNVTMVCHTPDVIMEHDGPFPPGKLGRGFYNLQNKVGLMGHLRPERLVKVGFMLRPFFGLETGSVLFINPDGGCAFKIFIKRGEDKKLVPKQLALFEALREKLS